MFVIRQMEDGKWSKLKVGGSSDATISETRPSGKSIGSTTYLTGGIKDRQFLELALIQEFEGERLTPASTKWLVDNGYRDLLNGNLYQAGKPPTPKGGDSEGSGEGEGDMKIVDTPTEKPTEKSSLSEAEAKELLEAIQNGSEAPGQGTGQGDEGTNGKHYYRVELGFLGTPEAERLTFNVWSDMHNDPIRAILIGQLLVVHYEPSDGTKLEKNISKIREFESDPENADVEAATEIAVIQANGDTEVNHEPIRAHFLAVIEDGTWKQRIAPFPAP